jgi:hypothetical protein
MRSRPNDRLEANRFQAAKMRTLASTWCAVLVLLSLVVLCPVAHAAKAEVSSKVPPGKWKAVRLKNLPEGAGLGIKVVANGSLVVILVHEAELKRYPAPVSPLFQGTLERTLSFSVVIPDPGNYYVILDNRRGTQERRARVLIQAKRPASRDDAPQDSTSDKRKI